MENMLLQKPIDSLPATSPVTVKRMKTLGIATYEDLLNHFPYRYEDYSLISPIYSLQEGETVTVKGIISESKNQFTRSGISIQKIVIRDASGDTIQLTWYNQPYLLKILRIGTEIMASGIVDRFAGRLSISPAEWETVKNIMLHTGRIVPVYPETRGLSSRTIREKVHIVLNEILHSDSLVEFLPSSVIKEHHLESLQRAIKNIHFPSDQNSLKNAKRRLGFDELLRIQLISQLTRMQWKKRRVKHTLMINSEVFHKMHQFIDDLPFKLTDDQLKAVKEILADLEAETPMNRFLQGDVGSGKTVVAAVALFVTVLNGYRALFMAPTEILASQHYQTLQQLFSRYKLKLILQTGSKKTLKQNEDFDIAVGTHALLSKSLIYRKIGLVIIDEQHRFGVTQRALLKQKSGEPHLLTMTATPIPRTLALALYGELDVSSIRQMPKGRLPIRTYLVPQEKRAAAYEWIRNKIRSEKIQVFIICPIIEESYAETPVSVKAAKREFERLKNEVFYGYRLDLLHGKLPSKEKENVMSRFLNGETDILVSTSVVEVGIDVPNATVMIIEGADRFGLAQLHQLRGRIGRGKAQSYCYLFSDSADENVIKRLSFFSQTIHGDKLAEYDLHRRGPGSIFGTQQHGFMKLKIASLSDISQILEVKKVAEHLLKISPDLQKFPLILSQVKKLENPVTTSD